MRGILSAVLLAIPLFLLSACSEQIVDADKLQERGGLVYLPNEESPFTGKANKRYDESDQIKSEISLKDGKPHGLVMTWYENGQKSAEANYKDGKRHGLSMTWHENASRLRAGRGRTPAAQPGPPVPGRRRPGPGAVVRGLIVEAKRWIESLALARFSTEFPQ